MQNSTRFFPEVRHRPVPGSVVRRTAWQHCTRRRNGPVCTWRICSLKLLRFKLHFVIVGSLLHNNGLYHFTQQNALVQVAVTTGRVRGQETNCVFRIFVNTAGWATKKQPAFCFARVLVIFSLALVCILRRVFEQLVNSRAVTMLRYTRCNIVILMVATMWLCSPSVSVSCADMIRIPYYSSVSGDT